MFKIYGDGESFVFPNHISLKDVEAHLDLFFSEKDAIVCENNKATPFALGILKTYCKHKKINLTLV